MYRLCRSRIFKYPVSIVRLRSYLHSLAHDQLPDHVTLPHTEDDIAAIHGYLEYVVGMAAERLRLLEEKHAADLAAVPPCGAASVSARHAIAPFEASCGGTGSGRHGWTVRGRL